jgi:dihydropteroate synthase
VKLVARGREITFSEGALVMGIVNLSHDSFSGDGCPTIDDAVARAHSLVEDGAAIIDIGAESARTNRGAISEQEETDDLCAFVDAWQRSIENRKSKIENPIPLSINTWRPAVARAVLREGGDILNDIGGLGTDENARIAAEAGAALVIMHTVGPPKVPHTHVQYDDVMDRLETFFGEKIRAAEAAGLSGNQVILDPGIDFAKQRDDNLRIYRELERLQTFDRPILLPVSRKTVIGDVLGLPPAERDAGTVACAVAGLVRGAKILRVHNVHAVAQAARVVHAVQNASGWAVGKM